MVKLAHFPGRGELKSRSLQSRLDLDPDIELFPDYATTLASGIDDTMRNLRIITDSAHPHEEASRTRDRAIGQLTEEVRTLREQLAKVVTTVNMKASKGQLAKIDAALTEKWAKKVDNLKWWIGGVGTVVSTLIAFKGR
jgi:hypothetical protein